MNNVIECRSISKSFADINRTLQVLQDLNLQVAKGEQVAIMGRSGSGKTTLLQLLGGLDLPTSGQITICGKNIHQLSEKKRAPFRNLSIGFIYQLHYLLPEFTAIENVAMPLLIRGMKMAHAKEKAAALLAEVGLQDRTDHEPAKLSGGERQRVAVARAIVSDPECVLADEPTGSLDAQSAEYILSLLQKLNRQRQTSFVIVTHDASLANKLDCVYDLQDGHLVKR